VKQRTPGKKLAEKSVVCREPDVHVLGVTAGLLASADDLAADYGGEWTA
jgi:hypothetical protein